MVPSPHRITQLTSEEEAHAIKKVHYKDLPAFHDFESSTWALLDCDLKKKL